jgi:hypothetical protein
LLDPAAAWAADERLQRYAPWWYGPLLDRDTHQRYLEYRERHAYFGSTGALLTRDQFLAADEEHRALDAKGEARDDEEEARYEELSKLLLRD